jgi:hypothetical protein
MYYVQVHTLIDAVMLLLCRILYWLFLHNLTPSRRIAMMLTWKTVGLHGPSSTSLAVATCALRAEECPRMAFTKQAQSAQMMSNTTWFSSAPLRS